MKLSRTLYLLCLALYTQGIISMEKTSIDTQAPYAQSTSREAIRHACLAFMLKKIDLDQLFDRILPAEVIHGIMTIAYDKELNAYFFSKDRLTNFLNNNQSYAQQEKNDLSWMIQSSPNTVHLYPKLKNLTCTLELNNGQVIAGFSSGKISLFDPGIRHARDIYPGHKSAISALAGKMDNHFWSFIVGYQDGSFSSLSLGKLHQRICPHLYEKPISCVAYTELPNLYVFAGGNTVGCAQLRDDLQMRETAITIDNEPTEEPYNITGIGTFNGCIVAQTTKNEYFIMAPYSREDCKIITRCAFSPLQASCIYHMIQEKKLISELELSDSDGEMTAFKKLSPTLQKFFETRQE
jgi:hypothetical protein